jgi:hypothetical protein
LVKPSLASKILNSRKIHGIEGVGLTCTGTREKLRVVAPDRKPPFLEIRRKGFGQSPIGVRVA